MTTRPPEPSAAACIIPAAPWSSRPKRCRPGPSARARRSWRTACSISTPTPTSCACRRVDQVRHFKSFLKLCADRNAFNILLVGETSIRDVIASVDYLRGRGGFPNKTLDPLGETKTEFEQFCMLLDGIDNRLPFATKSGLANERVARDVHRHSGGLIGRVMELVQFAAFEAINDGTNSIMIEHLQSAADTLVLSNDAYRYFRGV